MGRLVSAETRDGSAEPQLVNSVSLSLAVPRPGQGDEWENDRFATGNRFYEVGNDRGPETKGGSQRETVPCFRSFGGFRSYILRRDLGRLELHDWLLVGGVSHFDR